MVRFKNRWLLVEFIPCPDGDASFAHRLRSSSDLTGKQIWASLKQSVLTNFGDSGWGAVGYSLTGESPLIIGRIDVFLALDRSEVLLAHDQCVHHTRRA